MRYPEDVAEEDGRGLSGKPLVKGQKECSHTEREGEHHADRKFTAVEFVSRNPHKRPGHATDEQHPLQRGESEECRSGGPGESYVGKGMSRKTNITNNHKVADDRTENRSDRARKEGIANEVVTEVA